MRSKPVLRKYSFGHLFTIFPFSFSLHHNFFFFVRPGSPAFEALLKIRNDMHTFSLAITLLTINFFLFESQKWRFCFVV